MSIYTKRGDFGKTNIFSKKNKLIKVKKDSLVIEVLGSIDEVNSFIGIVLLYIKNEKIFGDLEKIQKNLMLISSIVANYETNFFRSEVNSLEKKIDKIEAKLARISNFIIFQGSNESSYLQYLRAITRRCERLFFKLNGKKKLNQNILSYINRLSDYFYVLARLLNSNKKLKEKVWLVDKD